jgi:hypothetical protein
MIHAIFIREETADRLVATFARMERHVSLCLQAEGNKISTPSAIQLSPNKQSIHWASFVFIGKPLRDS